MWSRLTHHWVRAGLAVLIVGIVLFALGITAYAIHVCASATALIDSAGEIRTMADAEREFAKWRKNSRVEFWIEGDGSGGDGNYYARMANLAIARPHVVEPSEGMTRVMVRDGKLLRVSVDVYIPPAPVTIEEWFKPGFQNRFYLSYIKGAVPMARVQFPSSLPDPQRRKAFVVRTRCLVLPSGCESAEDVLPVIRDLKSGLSPFMRCWLICCVLVSNHGDDERQSTKAGVAPHRLLCSIPLSIERDCLLNRGHKRRSTCGTFTQRYMQTGTGKNNNLRRE